VSKKAEREERAWARHREIGEPEGYDGPCWGPTHADFAFVDAQLKTERDSLRCTRSSSVSS
jgi:hypothetical protein